ncbi:MAG: hypothetical protein NY202_01245 [Mollicutes bacterium UO1]
MVSLIKHRRAEVLKSRELSEQIAAETDITQLPTDPIITSSFEESLVPTTYQHPAIIKLRDEEKLKLFIQNFQGLSAKPRLEDIVEAEKNIYQA